MALHDAHNDRFLWPDDEGEPMRLVFVSEDQLKRVLSHAVDLRLVFSIGVILGLCAGTVAELTLGWHWWG